jgi:4-hydroxybenzoate polyprenyltransferase
MIKRFLIILESIKFGHSIFAMPFAVLSVFIASGGWPEWGKLGLVVLCMVLARNVAMMYNRVADADLDAKNPRTRERAIPAGQISRRWAIGFIGTNAMGLVAISSLFGFVYYNYLPVVFSLPLLGYLCVYSHLKRYTWLCHFWLGGALGLSVIAGFLAIDPQQLSAGSFILAGAVACWTCGFDIIYGALDYDFDRKYGVHSLPAKIGVGKSLMISRLLHAASVIGFGLAGWLLELGGLFGLGVVLAGLALIYEHRLVRKDDLSRVNVAFFTMNGLVSMTLAVMGMIDLFVFGKGG